MALTPRIRAQIFNTPLMVDPAKALVMLGAVGERVAGGAITVRADVAPPAQEMGVLTGRLDRYLNRQQSAGFARIDDIAIIEIEGTLVEKGAWVGMDCGETSYEGVRTQVERIRRDASIKGVVLEIDSFGGQVAGAFETAAAIRRLAAEKPMMAILTSSACSAAYLLGSQASRIVMPEFGFAGSIGAVTMHIDMSRKLDAEGITVTMLASGAHKAEGNTFNPLPEDVAARIRADLDTIRGRMAEVVGSARGARFNAKAALATEAISLPGKAALAAGMIDAIGDPHEAFAAFAIELRRR